jgi:tetratricopeptide (TPR) repeat protein
MASLLVSCSRTPQPRVQRIAILRFDNQTGEASSNWISTAAPSMLAGELTGLPSTLPLPANTVREGYLDNATRFVHGYFDRREGKLHFEIEVEDPARRKMVLVASEEGPPLEAMSAVARDLNPAAHTFSTTNAEAAALWGQGDSERAIALDPGFGAAWTSWIQQRMSAGDTSGALDLASRALAQAGLRSSIDRVRIELLAATLRQDEEARRKALEELGRLTPADPSVWNNLAGLEMSARSFAEAARAYRHIVQDNPQDAAAANMLGYSDAMVGNLSAARTSFERYGRLPGQQTNSLDSLGEAYFLNGKFAEAEQSFLKAYARDPSFLAGATLWKAAHARWLAGDLPGADRIIQRYWKADAKDPFLTWRQGTWLYESGRRQQAMALLQDILHQRVPALTADILQRQLDVWNNPHAIPRDLDQLKKLYEQTDPPRDGLVRTFYAAALLDAGQKEAARKLVRLWPLPETSESLLESYVYPEFLRLRKAVR